MRPLRAVHYVMGTVLDCTLFDLPETPGRGLLRQGVQEVRRLERLLSVHDSDSALSHLNRQAGHGPVQVAAELWHLLARCVALTRQTDGAFDISAASKAAGGSSGGALRLYAEGWVELAPGACLDLGGIGKGYAVDQLVVLFQAAGVSRAFINFGDSSLYPLGEPPDAQGWPILVRGLGEEELLGVLWVKGGAISTSHSFGRRLGTGVSHILDPRTGLPVPQACLSTIIASSATLAEALSTAAVVSGTAWAAMLTRFPAAEGLSLGPDRVLHCTAGLTRCFQPCSEV